MTEQIIESTDVEIVEDIKKALRVLNDRLAVAGDNDIAINLEMVVLNGKIIPSLRLEAAYKRLDKPLILRA